MGYKGNRRNMGYKGNRGNRGKLPLYPYTIIPLFLFKKSGKY